MSDLIEIYEGVSVSRETEADLRAYADLVLKWTKKINLVSSSNQDEIWSRHVLDSVQVALLGGEDWSLWADFGSGGGFPGIVVGIFAKASGKSVVLVESDQRKCAFLRTCARELKLPVKVIDQRIEEIAPLNADVISARALASLDLLCGFAERHLGQNGICLFPKGRKAEEEIDLARQNWSFSLQSIPSVTAADAQILRLEGLIHA